MSDGGVCRTALATPDLLKIEILLCKVGDSNFRDFGK